MIKILLKAVVLIFIIISIYLIVHPAACSNVLSGRRTVGVTTIFDPALQKPHNEVGELLQPIGDTGTGVINSQGEDLGVRPEEGLTEQPFEGPSVNHAAPAVDFTQEDIDYAVASRYVELEREYAKNNVLGKDAAREISDVVMDDFQLSPKDWESFLSRATASNLFNRVRAEQQQMPPAVPAE